MRPIRFVNLGLTDYLKTQSLYHAIAARMSEDSADVIMLCIPDQPYLCLGLHQVLDRTLDRGVCESLGLPIVRRRVGGGATYLDENQLFYQFIFHHSRVPAIPTHAYSKLLAAPVSVLHEIGLNAKLCYHNEIAVNGNRIAGTGGGRINEASVVVGNYLKDFDCEVMEKVILSPSDLFRELAGDAMRLRITTLERENCMNMWAELPQLLYKACSQELGRELIESEPTEEEWEESEIQGTKLTSEQFLNRNSDRVTATSNWHFKVTGSTHVYQLQAVDKQQVCEVVVQVTDGWIERSCVLNATQSLQPSNLKTSTELPTLESLAVGVQWQVN